MHQVTRELLQEARSKQGVQQEIPRGALRDLQGHPNINRDVKAALDALTPYEHDSGDVKAALDALTPYEHDSAKLRQEVLRMIADQRTKITTGGKEVLF